MFYLFSLQSDVGLHNSAWSPIYLINRINWFLFDHGIENWLCASGASGRCRSRKVQSSFALCKRTIHWISGWPLYWMLQIFVVNSLNYEMRPFSFDPWSLIFAVSFFVGIDNRSCVFLANIGRQRCNCKVWNLGYSRSREIP